MAAPKKVDYDLIETDWRAGVKTPAQLAAEYTDRTGVVVSRAAISRHFAKLGVPRDLEAKIRARTAAMVSDAMVAAKVPKGTNKADSVIIDANAEVISKVLLEHQEDIGRGRALTTKLLAELEQSTDGKNDLQALAELLLDAPDAEGSKEKQRKRWEAFEKAVSLPGRSKTLKDLAETMRIFIDKERQAYRVDSDSGARVADAFESLLDLAAQPS